MTAPEIGAPAGTIEFRAGRRPSTAEQFLQRKAGAGSELMILVEPRRYNRVLREVKGVGGVEG